ncbi:MAG: DUF4390 domain-containing protein [Gemmatimonadota bacterium]
MLAWRSLLGAVILGAALAATAAAQGAGQLKLAVHLAPASAGTGARDPIVATTELLDDPRWRNALTSGLPLRLHYRLELWRTRSGWLDDLQRQVEWDVVIQREPLLEQFSVALVTSRGRRENRYATLDALSAALAVPYRVAIRVTEPASYFYTATLTVSTLSDRDLREFERFLRGDLGPAAGGEESFGDAVGRGAKRILLRLAGLPGTKIEARSETFAVAAR